jgi:outer membrane lipoprotein-sorting protein
LLRNARLASLVLLLATSAAFAAGTEAGPPGSVPTAASVLARLETKLSGVTNVQAGFLQERRLSILDQALHLEGRLAVALPDRMAWHVDAPVRYSLVLQGNVARQWDEDTGRVQQLSLARNPVFQVVFQQLQTWFSGRYASLTNDYEVAVQQEQPAILEFRPKPQTFTARDVRRIQVAFQGDECYLRRIEIEENRGDFTAMVFTNAQVNTAIPAALWEAAPPPR